MSRHPMQKIEWVGDTIRFRRNALVEYLLDHGGITMNDLAVLPDIPRGDREQFAQLIGYSVGGFGDLGYASKKAIRKADKKAAAIRAGKP